MPETRLSKIRESLGPVADAVVGSSEVDPFAYFYNTCYGDSFKEGVFALSNHADIRMQKVDGVPNLYSSLYYWKPPYLLASAVFLLALCKNLQESGESVDFSEAADFNFEPVWDGEKVISGIATLGGNDLVCVREASYNEGVLKEVRMHVRPMDVTPVRAYVLSRFFENVAKSKAEIPAAKAQDTSRNPFQPGVGRTGSLDHVALSEYFSRLYSGPVAQYYSQPIRRYRIPDPVWRDETD